MLPSALTSRAACRFLAACLACLSLLTACRDARSALVEKRLEAMTLREKVGQMFFVRPEQLSPAPWDEAQGKNAYHQCVSENLVAASRDYPVGGILLLGEHIRDGRQLKAFTAQLKALDGAPLLCIDEEGGRVARIANNDLFDVPRFASMAAVGATGRPKEAYACGKAIGRYLRKYGFDIDFAPVADVNTNPQNIVIGDRAFSDNPRVAAPMVVQYLKGLQDAGVMGCIKHFPGHGDTEADTHLGVAQSLKTWPQMRDCEMIPFQAGIREGCRLVMVSHIAAPLVTVNDLPATLSQELLLGKLRGELHYKGLIITDSMDMRAITDQYTASSAAICSILSGVDIVLTPEDFTYTFDAVVDAVECGVIPEERIDESVRRILSLKLLLSGR